MIVPIRQCRLSEDGTVMAAVEYAPDQTNATPCVKYMHGCVQRNVSNKSQIAHQYKDCWNNLVDNLDRFQRWAPSWWTRISTQCRLHRELLWKAEHQDHEDEIADDEVLHIREPFNLWNIDPDELVQEAFRYLVTSVPGETAYRLAWGFAAGACRGAFCSAFGTP